MPAGMMLTSSHLYGDTFKALSAQPCKMIKHKQFIGNSQRIVWVCLTIVWAWRLKG